MPDLFILFAILTTFLLAGTVKGIVGFGLPTVSLALLTVTIGLPDAMALILVPSFITNLWQALAGGNGGAILRRLWLFLLSASAAVWLGVWVLTRVNMHSLSGLLGALIIIYSVVALAGLNLALTKKQETGLAPLIGFINGLLTGMTGAFVVPGVFYLQSIGLTRDMLIQAMGMLFTVSTLALGISMQANHLLTVELGQMSVVALLPAIIGMAMGQKIRGKLPEKHFRRIFFISLFILGAYILLNSYFSFT